MILVGICIFLLGGVNNPISIQDENILPLSSTTGKCASATLMERIPQISQGNLIK